MGKPTPQVLLLVKTLTTELKQYIRQTETSNTTILDILFSEMLVEVLIEICQNFTFDETAYEVFEFLWRSWKYQKELTVTREMMAMVPVSLKINIKICKFAIDGSSAFAGGPCKIN